MTHGVSTTSLLRRVKRKRKWRLWLGGYALFIMATWLLILFLDPSSFHDPSPPADLTSGTPYLQHVADALRTSPLYVDPSLNDIPAPTADELGGDPPVFLAVMPSTRSDGSGGVPEVALARVAHLVGRSGVYATLDQNDECSAIVVHDSQVTTTYCSHRLTADDIAQLRDANDDSTGSDDRVIQYVYPVLVGLGACVLVGLFFDLIAWLWRRRVSYLPGLR